jgi:large-conductance mechanosensitive channel
VAPEHEDEKRRFAWKGAVFDLALGVLINSRLG